MLVVSAYLTISRRSHQVSEFQREVRITAVQLTICAGAGFGSSVALVVADGGELLDSHLKSSLSD